MPHNLEYYKDRMIGACEDVEHYANRITIESTISEGGNFIVSSFLMAQLKRHIGIYENCIKDYRNIIAEEAGIKQ